LLLKRDGKIDEDYANKNYEVLWIYESSQTNAKGGLLLCELRVCRAASSGTTGVLQRQ
jgi:hypothetical protein